MAVWWVFQRTTVYTIRSPSDVGPARECVCAQTGKPLPATLSSDTGLPRKRFYRARAHSNPLNDCQFEVPRCPQDNEWSALYPAFFAPKAGAKEGWVSKDPTAKVRFADVGCGFGGLLVRQTHLVANRSATSAAW